MSLGILGDDTDGEPEQQAVAINGITYAKSKSIESSVPHDHVVKCYKVPDNVYFFDTYVDAAIHAATRGLMTKEAMW